MKSPMRTAFEQWFGFEVSDDMDIQTSVAWDNWRIAWAAATKNAARRAEEHAKNNAYTPAQKRALDSWLRRAVLASGIESSNGGLNRRDGSVADGTSALKPLLGEDGGE